MRHYYFVEYFYVSYFLMCEIIEIEKNNEFDQSDTQWMRITLFVK